MDDNGLRDSSNENSENSVERPTFRKKTLPVARRVDAPSAPSPAPMALVAAVFDPPVAPELKRKISTNGFDKTNPEEKINYDEMINEVDLFLNTLIGFEQGTHARKGVHEFVYYFCESADPEQVVDFLTAVLLPLQFNLETCREMVSRIGNGYTLVTGRPPLSYLRMFSLSPSDQLPLALRHINQKNINQGYLQEGTLNQYNDQALLSHTMDFFETELRKTKEDFTTEQISILLMDPQYKEGNALTVCGVELIQGKGKTGRALEEEEEEEEEPCIQGLLDQGRFRLDFSPQYKIAGHVSNIKNLTLALVALADTNKDLLEHQETEYPEGFATLQLELMMLMKLGRKFNTQHETLNFEFPDENMKLVTSSYLSRLYVFAGNFRDMVRKEYLIEQDRTYEDKSQGRPFEKLFLFNLARSVALIACTVPEMEDAILLSKKLGPDPQRLRVFFQQYAKAANERNVIFLQICQKMFTPDMFKDFPKIEKITIKTIPAVFRKYFSHYFKRDGKVIGVFPEIVPFKEAITFPRIGASGWKSGYSRKMTHRQLSTAGISMSRNPDQEIIDTITGEIVDAIEKGSVLTKEYNMGYQDGIRLLPMNKEYLIHDPFKPKPVPDVPLTHEQYLKGYLSGQRAFSGMKGLIHEVDENKDQPDEKVEENLNTLILETRAKMAYGAMKTIQMLTFKGMENTFKLIKPLFISHSLFECLQYYSNKLENAAELAEKAYQKTKQNYDTFLTLAPVQSKKRDLETIRYEERLRLLRMDERRENRALIKVRSCAQKAKEITIPEPFRVRFRPKIVRPQTAKVQNHSRGIPMTRKFIPKKSFTSRP